MTGADAGPKAAKLVVYSYHPKGAGKQRRFAVATGDKPEDILSTHGSRDIAIRAGERLAKSLGVPLSVEV